MPLSEEYAAVTEVPIGAVALIVRRPHDRSGSGANSSVSTDPEIAYRVNVAVTSCTLGEVADGVKRSRRYWR